MIKNAFKYLVYITLRLYFSLRHAYPVWFYLLNFKRRRLYRKFQPIINKEAKRVAEEFISNGIAVTHLDKLFSGEEIFSKLEKYVTNLRAETEKRLGYNKKFLEYLWDYKPVLDAENPLLKLVMRPTILGIANYYMRFFAKFYYFTLNVTLPVTPGSLATKSQKWHRDPEDKKMVKVFLYLTDVDKNSGPFMYVLKSHYGEKRRGLAPQRPPAGIYPKEGTVESTVGNNEIKICIGRAGTLIFADTTGLHRGGYATKNERVMFTAAFASSASPWPVLYKCPENAEAVIANLGPLAKYVFMPNSIHISSSIFNRFLKLIKWGND